MSRAFATGHDALAECDICGFRYKLRQLRELVINEELTNLKACPECWNEDHPQYQLGKYPVDDPQAIRDPRPDFAGYEESRAMRVVIKGVSMTGVVGQVTISV